MDGSGCVLNLTYAPTAADAGTLVAHLHLCRQCGALEGARRHDHHSLSGHRRRTTWSPPPFPSRSDQRRGRRRHAIGQREFHDGYRQRHLGRGGHQLVTTDLSRLPAGWSSAAPSFSCAIVTSGNGCELMLDLCALRDARSGMLTLNYAYTDDPGARARARSTFRIATTSSNTVVATASPRRADHGGHQGRQPGGRRRRSTPMTARPRRVCSSRSSSARCRRAGTARAGSFQCAQRQHRQWLPARCSPMRRRCSATARSR